MAHEHAARAACLLFQERSEFGSETRAIVESYYAPRRNGFACWFSAGGVADASSFSNVRHQRYQYSQGHRKATAPPFSFDQVYRSGETQLTLKYKKEGNKLGARLGVRCIADGVFTARTSLEALSLVSIFLKEALFGWLFHCLLAKIPLTRHFHGISHRAESTP